MTGSYCFLQRNIGTESCLFFQKNFLICGLNFFRVSSRQSVPALSVREKTIVLLVSDPVCFQTLDHD